MYTIYIASACVLAALWRIEALVLVLLVVAGAWLGPILRKRTTQRYIRGSKGSLWEEYEAMVRDKPVFSGSMFFLHKGPQRLRYILMNEDAKGVIEDLDFIRKYNPEVLADAIIYLEYFFKVHYNVMIQKYDPCTYITILQDVSKACLNTLARSTFNIPKVSTIIDIPDLDEYMEGKIRALQAIMESYMQVLKNKYRDSCPQAFAVYASGGMGDPHDMF